MSGKWCIKTTDINVIVAISSLNFKFLRLLRAITLWMEANEDKKKIERQLMEKEEWGEKTRVARE